MAGSAGAAGCRGWARSALAAGPWLAARPGSVPAAGVVGGWLAPAGAAPPLIGGGAADAHGFEAGEAGIRLVARYAGKAAVDDQAHAVDGQRRLGNGGGQHQLALAVAARTDGGVLLGRRQ